jgi:colanic acid biosynthesis glycosyl transferase WcaI
MAFSEPHISQPHPTHPDRKTLLIFTQVFVPDPAAVGQHIANVAFEMARRGHRVLVYTANRGYDDPSLLYPSPETLNGVEIRRLKFSSFGKRRILTRLIGTASFMLQALFIALFTPNVHAILFSTSPPLIGIVPSIARILRRIPIVYWAMDLNPDQLIAMGKISPHGLPARILEAANRFILSNSTLIVTLDRFMAYRLRARARLDHKLIILPPWPHDDRIEPLDHAQNPFRIRHALAGKFVIMYSGNHSPSNPLTTLLDASRQLQDHPDIRFLFVGGGIGKKEIDAFIRTHNPKNVLSLPYQPLTDLRYSLAAADVHVVSLGQAMVGIIHPCKIYGAMSVARPILFLGPQPSHISDLLNHHPFGFHVAHGDVPAAVQAIRHLRSLSPSQLLQMGKTAQLVVQQSLSQKLLCGQFCNHLQRMLDTSPRC